MAQTLSASFEQIYANTVDAVLYGSLSGFTDLSTYANDAKYTAQNDATDQTTFGASGGASAKTTVRGALDGRISLKLNFDPTVAYWLQQVWGLPGGFTFVGYSGSNAAPSPGDEVFVMSAILLAAPHTYNPGNTSTITIELMPVDGGIYPPDFYRL